MRLDVTGKRILVTGASSGLGAHFARVLARGGARVAIGARRTERLEDLATELAAEGAEVVSFALDVGDQTSISDGIAALAADWGGIDVLVNNAGIASTKPAIDYAVEDFDSIVDVNLRGAFLVARHVAQAMRDYGTGGSIINIASILGLRQAGQVAAYAISKAGVVQMTKVLALEWARFGIRVNALAPGYIQTELNERVWETESGQAMLKRIPQRRLGRPEELEAPLLLLASDASTYMTGSILVIDGGHSVSTL
jgi:NAD(P)-dependent dehydrogenase (short-subunit alcohol dehydrogenase family)